MPLSRTISRPFFRGTAAALLALIIGAAVVVLFGVVVPIWGMTWLHGFNDVNTLPANGSAVLLVTVPYSAGIALPLSTILTAVFYGLLSPAPKLPDVI